MSSATARHILVKSQEECESIKKEIAEGAQFTDMAQKHSLCPSGKSGGDLGSFSPGQMVKEFDQVVFNQNILIGNRRIAGSVPDTDVTYNNAVWLLGIFSGS